MVQHVFWGMLTAKLLAVSCLGRNHTCCDVRASKTLGKKDVAKHMVV